MDSNIAEHPIKARARQLRTLSWWVFGIAVSLTLSGLICLCLAWTYCSWFFARISAIAFFSAAGLMYLQKRIERAANSRHYRWVQLDAIDDRRPPVLALRSITDSTLTKEPSIHLRRHPRFSGDEPGSSNLRSLGLAAEPLGRLVAIGRPLEKWAANEAYETLILSVSDANWFEVFERVAKAARAILLTPGTTDGLVQEINALRQLHFLDRTIVFMPPTPKQEPSYSLVRIRNPTTLAKGWADATAYWGERALHLPAYNPAGMLYRANPDLSIAESVVLEHHVYAKTMGAAMQQFAGADGESLAAVLHEIRHLTVGLPAAQLT